ncbi:MAG TPA: hypothetical protein VF799_05945, partial [Geobacteraceae bacterium]
MSEVQIENIRMNPSVEHVVAQYLYYRNVVDQLADGNTKRFCNEKLERVDALLVNPYRRRITLVWRLLHRVGEELFLVMGPEELAAEGHKLLEDLKIASVPDTLKNHWIEILHGKITELEKYLAASAASGDNQENGQENMPEVTEDKVPGSAAGAEEAQKGNTPVNPRNQDGSNGAK